MEQFLPKKTNQPANNFPEIKCFNLPIEFKVFKL